MKGKMILIHRSKLLILSSKPYRQGGKGLISNRHSWQLRTNCFQILKKLSCQSNAFIQHSSMERSGMSVEVGKSQFLDWNGVDLLRKLTNRWGYSALVTTELCMHQFLGRRLKFSPERDSNLRVKTELFISLQNLYFMMQTGCLVT